MYKFWILALLPLVFASGCSTAEQSSKTKEGKLDPPYSNRFNIEQQKPPPRAIQSIQLYRKGQPGSPPVITLEGEDKLVLEFDHLDKSSRQFRITVSHRNRHWEQSPLPDNFYLEGFNETQLGGGLSSFSQQPSYRHYSYEFPNSQLSFKTSGNYLLSVYSYRGDSLLFSLPFLVSENRGALETRIETLYGRGESGRRIDQPFSRYRYPPFVEFPQFDLSFIYVQNQFWGRAREVDFFNTSTPDLVEFHLGREHSFPGDYEFNTLDLRSLSADGRNILEVRKGPVPPRVILRRDTQAFSTAPRFAPEGRFGRPVDDRSASYAEVAFSLEADENTTAGGDIYMVGDFNNWTINSLNRMRFNPGKGLWEGTAFIKEGEYAYKYVVLRNGQIDDVHLDQSFRFVRQNYLTLVYYRDPTRNYDRLLKTGLSSGPR